MIDDGATNSTSSTGITASNSELQAKVVSLQHTRILSPTLLNIATLGYSRAYTHSVGSSTIELPDSLRFVEGQRVGNITIGGSLISGGSTVSRVGGGGRENFGAQNLYTVKDDVTYSRGRHSLGFGVWVQKSQVNPGSPPTAGDGAVQPASWLAR
jgi:hypothetical protein